MKTLLLLGVLLVASALFAQEATISGRVLRRGVVPMDRAHVTYTNTETGAVFQVRTDSTGFYSISSIPLSAPTEERSLYNGANSLVTNCVGASCCFYFSSNQPLKRARVFDILGREVAALELKSERNGLWISAGFWDGRTLTGVPAADGVYFAVVIGESSLHALKFIHLRSGRESAPPLVTESIRQALRITDAYSRPRGRYALDDAFMVTFAPDSLGRKFAARTVSRALHDGDNGFFADTVFTEVPHSILFVGNSYTYVNGGVDVHLRNLVASAHPAYNLTTTNVTVGGYTLGDHWQYAPTRDSISSGRWDVVVLQEQSQRPQLEPDSFYYFARLLNGEILHAEEETAFYMTWARQNDPPMIEPLAAAYDSMGCELGAVVAPCGRAFQRVVETDSTINLYDTDGSHPSVWGTYLACCVFYASLMQESPVGISYVNDPRITDAQRLFLQTVAWETVSGATQNPLPLPTFSKGEGLKTRG